MVKNRYVLALFILVIFFCSNQKIWSQDPDLNQDREHLGAWIMGRVVEKARENEIIKRENITYVKTIYKYNIDKNPHELLGGEVFNISGKDGKSIEKLIERIDKENRRTRVNNSKSVVSSLNFDTIIGERYDFRLIKEEMISDRGYFLISFRPKEPLDKLPFDNKIDEGINRMYGTLYVDIENLYVWRLDGQLKESFRKAANIFEMNNFQIVLVQEKRFGVVVPSSLNIIYSYRVLFSHTNEKLVYAYSNHTDKREEANSNNPP